VQKKITEKPLPSNKKAFPQFAQNAAVIGLVALHAKHALSLMLFGYFLASLKTKNKRSAMMGIPIISIVIRSSPSNHFKNNFAKNVITGSNMVTP
jgi:hypothetical protein